MDGVVLGETPIEKTINSTVRKMFLHVGSVPASPSSFLLTPFATTTLPFYQPLISSLPISDQRDALDKMPPTNHLRAQVIAPLVHKAINWLKDNNALPRSEIEVMQADFEEVEAELKNKLPLLKLRDLEQAQVERIFQIREVDRHDKDVKWTLPFFTPDRTQFNEFFARLGNYLLLRSLVSLANLFNQLGQAMSWMRSAQAGSKPAEALVRTRVDLILGFLLGWVKENNLMPGAQRISWGYETRFTKEVWVKARKKALQGNPDYQSSDCRGEDRG